MDEVVGGVLSFWGRCESGKSGSGGFLDLRSLKKGFEDGDFFGVVMGLL